VSLTRPTAPNRRLQYQVKADPIPQPIPPPPPVFFLAATLLSVGIVVVSQFQYQAQAKPIAPVETVTVDKWHELLSEPVRTRQLPTALQQQPVLVLNPDTQVTQNYESRWHYQWSEPVRQKPGLHASAQSFIALQLDAGTQITQTYESRWHYPWSEPVRTRQLAPAQQQSAAFVFVPPPPVAPALPTPSTGYVGITVPYQLQYQGTTAPFFVGETITVDKWFASWRDPVRDKPGLRVSQQPFQALILDPNTEITQTYESRWHYPWSEPVRQKPGLAAYLQHFIAQTVLEPNTQIIQTYESRWHYAWSDPVRVRQLAPAQQQAAVQAPFVAETITVDKWFAPWREPVRERPGLRASLQPFQAFILDPSTEITQTYESRWHYPWSEPVRTRQLATAQQQPVAQGEPSFEIVTADKWIYPWTEPVRSKPGLLAALQHFTAQTVLDPDTQITQGYESKWHYAWSEPVRSRPYQTNLQPFQAFVLDPSTEITQTYESRWHYAWSEPVRVRQLATAQQQVATQGEPTFEIVTMDKWTYPWSEPVRQKPGLAAYLQHFIAQTVLNPETQITQGYESRWHYAWSEPVRQKPGLLANLQQAQAQGPVQTPEFITLDKWFIPWPEPVRQKPGLSASLQPFFAFVLDPSTEITQTYESRWHYAWSEPVRVRALATAQQQALGEPATSVFETITVDKWYRPFNEPVRTALRTAWYQPFTIDTAAIPVSSNESLWHQPWSEPSVKYRLRATWYQPYTADTLAIPISRLETWYSPLSEPSVKYRLRTPEYRAFTSDTAVIPSSRFEADWHYAWSEPVRLPVGLKSYLQQAPILAVPPFPTFQRTIPWLKPFDEPVRSKPGLAAQYQSFFTISPQPLARDIFLTLSATEVNTDSASFAIAVYNQAVSIAVSVREIPATLASVVSVKEIPAVLAAAVSTEEIPAVSAAAVSIEELVPFVPSTPSGALTTESGDPLTTEGGDTLTP
jgi:hypothetical protein